MLYPELAKHCPDLEYLDVRGLENPGYGTISRFRSRCVAPVVLIVCLLARACARCAGCWRRARLCGQLEVASNARGQYVWLTSLRR